MLGYVSLGFCNVEVSLESTLTIADLLERPTFLFVILYIVRSFDKELPIWRLNRLIEGEQNHERTHIHTTTETTLSSFVV